MDYIDDDENVKAMRETARVVGLTESLLRIHTETERLRREIDAALTWLGVSPDPSPDQIAKGEPS
jgi:hypothetical protein